MVMQESCNDSILFADAWYSTTCMGNSKNEITHARNDCLRNDNGTSVQTETNLKTIVT